MGRTNVDEIMMRPAIEHLRHGLAEVRILATKTRMSEALDLCKMFDLLCTQIREEIEGDPNREYPFSQTGHEAWKLLQHLEDLKRHRCKVSRYPWLIEEASKRIDSEENTYRGTVPVESA